MVKGNAGKVEGPKNFKKDNEVGDNGGAALHVVPRVGILAC